MQASVYQTWGEKLFHNMIQLQIGEAPTAFFLVWLSIFLLSPVFGLLDIYWYRQIPACVYFKSWGHDDHICISELGHHGWS